MTGSPQDAPPGSPVPRDPGSDPVVDPLLVRLRRREEAAFSEFVRQNQDQVFGIVFRYLRNRAEAEDVAQEVFVTVFKSIEGFRGESKISTWLFRIATNHAKNRLRYRGRRAHGRHREFEAVAEYAVDDGGVLGERPPRPDEAAAGYELEGTIGNALATLDPDHRKLIVLREIEGRTYEEMITMTGLAPGTLKSKLHRARHALMEAVQRQEEIAMTKDEARENFSAAMDGELSEEEQQAFDRTLEANPELSAEYETFCQILGEAREMAAKKK